MQVLVGYHKRKDLVKREDRSRRVKVEGWWGEEDRLYLNYASLGVE